MPKRLIILFLLLFQTASISAYPPISEFPSPFLGNWSSYNGYLIPKTAIIIGSRADPLDLHTANIIADALKQEVNVSFEIPTPGYVLVKTVYSIINSTDGVPFVSTKNIAGKIYELNESCVNESYILVPLTNITMYPAKFPYLLGRVNESRYISGDRIVFYTGMLELRNGSNYFIPWLGYNISVVSVVVKSKTDYEIRMKIRGNGLYALVTINPSTMAGGFQFPGSGNVFMVEKPSIEGQGLKGTPFFKIENDPSHFLPIPGFNVVYVNITSLRIPGFALMRNITNPWPSIENATIFLADKPYKGYAVFFSSADNYSYYIPFKALGYLVRSQRLYIFNNSGTWSFNEARQIGCHVYLMTCIGRTYSTPQCPLVGSRTLEECYQGCEGMAGLYKVERTEYLFTGACGGPVKLYSTVTRSISISVPIYRDSQVFKNGVLDPSLRNTNLILIGGPDVNSVVANLQARGYLNATFVRNRSIYVKLGNETFNTSYLISKAYEMGVPNGSIDLNRIVRLDQGIGVIEYSNRNPWGNGSILVVAGTDRYGTLSAGLALVRSGLFKQSEFMYYIAGRSGYPNILLTLGIRSPLTNEMYPYRIVTIVPRKP
jgi:hypothetical protein